MDRSKKIILIAMTVLLFAVLAVFFGLIRVKQSNTLAEPAKTNLEMQQTEEKQQPQDETWEASKESEPQEPVAFAILEPMSAATAIMKIHAAEPVSSITIQDGTMRNEDIQTLVETFPLLPIFYRVSVGDLYVEPDVTELSGKDPFGACTVFDIAEELPYLPKLTTVRMDGATAAQILEAKKQLPTLNIAYTVSLMEHDVTATTETLDLTGHAELDAAALTELLPILPALQTVILGDRSADIPGALAFMEANPTLRYEVSYMVSYADRTWDNETETIDLSGHTLTDPGALAEALSRLPKLQSVNLLDCTVDDTAMRELTKSSERVAHYNDVLGGLCDALPKVRFLWEIDLGYWGKLRTDATAFTTRSSKSADEMKYRLTTETAWPLQYCTELVALDLGHQQIEDISFLATLTKLQVLILADNKISDITALASMPDLVYAELFINHISDLSPLSGLTKLKDLNLCTNRISDLTPLYSLTTLERLWYSNNAYHLKDHNALVAQLPNCKCNRTVWDETADGWREHERYFWMRAFFENSPRYKA